MKRVAFAVALLVPSVAQAQQPVLSCIFSDKYGKEYGYHLTYKNQTQVTEVAREIGGVTTQLPPEKQRTWDTWQTGGELMMGLSADPLYTIVLSSKIYKTHDDFIYIPAVLRYRLVAFAMGGCGSSGKPIAPLPPQRPKEKKLGSGY